MSKEREALQKIANMTFPVSDNDALFKFSQMKNLATEALEQSEPRKFSEEEVRLAIDLAWDKDSHPLVADMVKDEIIQSLSNYKEGSEGKTDKGWVALFSNEEEWIEYLKWRNKPIEDKPIEEGIPQMYRDESSPELPPSVEDNEITIQSLSQPIEDKPTEEGIPQMYMDESSPELPPSSVEEIAEKETIEALAEKKYPVMIDNETHEDRNFLARYAFIKGYSLARKQVIEEIEEWVKENTESVENQSGDRGGAIWTSELLTKLQTIKK